MEGKSEVVVEKKDETQEPGPSANIFMAEELLKQIKMKIKDVKQVVVESDKKEE